MTSEPPEIEQLEHAAAWRLRLVDLDPADRSSAAAAQILEQLAASLRHDDHADMWTELRSLGNWLAESDAISDYADLVTEYHARIGVERHPADAAAYLRDLLAIARSLV